jgi:hypothetical protein
MLSFFLLFLENEEDIDEIEHGGKTSEILDAYALEFDKHGITLLYIR